MKHSFSSCGTQTIIARLGLGVPVFAAEFIDAARRINDLLLTRIEGMAF